MKLFSDYGYIHPTYCSIIQQSFKWVMPRKVCYQCQREMCFMCILSPWTWTTVTFQDMLRKDTVTINSWRSFHSFYEWWHWRKTHFHPLQNWRACRAFWLGFVTDEFKADCGLICSWILRPAIGEIAHCSSDISKETYFPVAEVERKREIL